MPLPSNIPLLKHYVLSRWCCPWHGYFETGTLIAQQSAACPEVRCGKPADLVERCEGMTSRQIPFVSRPRLQSEGQAGIFQVTGDTGVTTKPKASRTSSQRGGRRATGRPKKKAAHAAEPIPPTPLRVLVTADEFDPQHPNTIPDPEDYHQ